MSDSKYSLSLLIKAVDQVTGPLNEINQRISAATLPVRVLGRSFAGLSDAAGLPKLGEALKNVGSSIQNVASQAVALGAKLLTIGAAAAYGLYSFVKATADAGSKLDEMSKRVGLSVDEYASLQFAAQKAHISQEDFNGGLDKFNKALGQAKAGGGPLLTFLNKVGPGLATQIKGAKGTADALSLMTDALARIEDPQRRAALAAAAFGKGGLQFGQFLGQGSKAIQELQRRFIELGGSQEEFAKNSHEVESATLDLDTAFLGLRNAAGTALFPALTKVAEALSDIVAGNRADISKWAKDLGDSLTAWVRDGGLDRLIAGLKNFATITSEIIEDLGGFKAIAAGLGLYLAGPLLLAIGGLVISLAQLQIAATATGVSISGALLPPLLAVGAAVLPFAVAAVAFTSIAAAGYQIYKNWQPLKEFFIDLWDSVKKVFNSMGGLVGIAQSIATKGVVSTAWTAAKGAGTSLFGDYADSHQSAFHPELVRNQSMSSKAQVSVDFSNAPKGVRVTTDPKSTVNVDTSLGYSMVSQ